MSKSFVGYGGSMRMYSDQGDYLSTVAPGQLFEIPDYPNEVWKSYGSISNHKVICVSRKMVVRVLPGATLVRVYIEVSIKNWRMI